MRNIFISLTALAVLSFGNSSFAAKTSRETLEMLDLFGDVFERVREEYVEVPDDKELIEAAINGMLTSLDPHSSYMNPESFDEMRVQTRGEFGGLGIEVTMKNGLVYIVSPIDDTPAYNAGLEAGDYITHINDESVVGFTIKEAVKRMRGKPKTKITLTILRETEDEPFDVVIKRDIITIKSVKSDKYNDVAYIRITSFTENTSSGVKKQLEELKQEIGEKTLKGVVLDLRNNPGGLLNQAIAVSDIFLDRGEIVSTRGREDSSTKRFNATSGDIINDLPLVILINGGSASASEIVAGALQDHGRGIVVGTKSFGKGSVQTVVPTPNNGAVRLTTSRYYTPSGRSIQADGIEPDITVSPAKIEIQKSKRRTSESDLKGHLDKGKESNDNVSKDEQLDEAKKLINGEEEKTLYEKDYQLARALDLLRGLYIFNNHENVSEELEAAEK